MSDGKRAISDKPELKMKRAGRSHGVKKPHYTFISAVRAFVPPVPMQ